jgi:hypothetical protein
MLKLTMTETYKKWILAALVALSFGLAGCRREPPSKAPANQQEANQQEANQPSEDYSGARLSAEQLSQAVQLKDRCVALLEEGAEAEAPLSVLQAAEVGFEQLSQQFPQDPLGVQNFCLTLLLQLKKIDRAGQATTFDQIAAKLDSELGKLSALKPEAAIASSLSARRFVLIDDIEQSLEGYRRAALKSDAGPDVHYQLFTRLSMADNSTPPEAQQALERALQQAPENLVLVIEWLKILAKNQDRRLVDMGPTCRELFRPLTARTSSSLPGLLEAAIQAASNNDWPMALRQTSFLRNVMLGELAFQQSLNLLEPHELEFVLLRFADETEQALRQATVASPSSRTAFQFVDLGERWQFPAGVTAIASEDFDLDGRHDLWLAGAGRLQVLSLAEGTTYEVLCDQELSLPVTAFAVADLDRDFQQRKSTLPPSALPTTSAPPNSVGVPDSSANSPTTEPMLQRFLDTDLDVVAYGEQGLQIFRNDIDPNSAKRSLTAVPLNPQLEQLKGIHHVAVIDFDHDADLDLVVSSSTGISLWSNRGDWTFADFTSYSRLPATNLVVTDILALDADRNVLNDFLLGSESTGDSLVLKSNLHGRYYQSPETWAESGFGGLRSIAAVDANADACWDVIGCGASGTFLTLMKSVGQHAWQPESRFKISGTPMHDLLTDDFDNDGYVDAVAWGPEAVEFFRGGAAGQLQLETAVLRNLRETVAVLAIDLDLDQDLDLVCLEPSGQLRCFDNAGGNSNASLELVIRADEDGSQRPRERCNMHGVGSLVELKAGGHYQAQIVRGTRTRFGLGSQNGADILRVLWTNGIPNNILDIQNRATVFDQQNLGGSCPYLYTWNGQRFEFCTDCLWAAPIGLQFAQGLAAPTRNWEHLRIDGRLLQPRNGEYILQLTEELWEAAYFDSVQLMAVDHPPEIEVYTNEKVGPGEMAEFKIHVVKHRQTPLRVMDSQGQDVSELVAKRDHRYSKTWERGLNQGLTETHWLELDLGELQDPTQVTLFLTGWMFPTCTSINLAMTENPLKPKQMPPSIWMPNAEGEWIETIPYAGFPGGKTKTIAIDLSNKFPCDDYRLRVICNMELCWDEIFFTSGDQGLAAPQAGEAADRLPYRVSRLPLVHADLHYRGFSELVPQPFNAPKRFEYESVTQASIWPPMQGAFTRYGEVTELLTVPDDLQVVIGAGDEITLRFEAAPMTLPEGWVRDFVLTNIGWDKDADLNTIQGQQVEPLPFRAMTQYPYEPGQSFPDSDMHRDFLQTFQTRIQSRPDFWYQIREHGSAKTMRQ